ncbi:organoarsenical efflux permease ArsP [Campylobacter jejuni]|uniref:Organoarsenical efflux permease ArsP n=2 Tax=Campylobacter jejuni TaxID=197 RepID=A0AAN4IVR2_CAMJU|nr:MULTISPECIES: organoarsenical efflux permease ArsP [Campylobacter]EAI1107323.1 organoarsenical efflux permease ArsP [Campylobacter coli]WPM70014.1 organoarsenical efflux permease ArsP [Campylobacter sp. CFSAN122719]AAW36156.1 permease, putative [Campylobacter jejuni RM1221]ADT73338.1 membrane protein [Campylobacter jejuni subsp. jejuni S3]AFU43561.1 membrane protein [Campylobacter jejuni subsp. jejuni PT14]
MQSFLNTFKEFLYLFTELSVLFIAISFLVSIINQKYEGIFKKQLAGDKISSYFKAIFLGALTPFCSCSTIPLLRAFLEAKVKLSVALAYLFTSPLINPIIFSMLFITFGLKLSLTYVVFLVFLIFIVSFVFSKFKEESFLKHIPKNTKSNIFTQTTHNPSNFIFKQKSCCANTQDKPKNITINYKELFKESLKNYKKLLPYIVVAVFIGAFIHGFIPQEILQKYLNGNEILSIVLAAFLGIFLYLRVETIIPIGLALLQMGISQGVIMSFLIAGAGCSLPELILLKQMFKIKFLFLFVMIILGVAISFGIFINLI